MPPSPASLIVDPNDMAADTLRWMEMHGIVPRVPTLRATDFDLINSCRFSYWLQRRMGLTPAFRYSEALTRGSWFHVAARAVLDPSRAKSAVEIALREREAELRAICATLRVGEGKQQAVIEQEREDAWTSYGWFRASMFYRRPRDAYLSKGLPAWLQAPVWKHLGEEVRLSYRLADTKKTVLVMEADRLMYNTQTQQLYLGEWKTCPASDKKDRGGALTRSQIIRIENQPRHYLVILAGLLREGALQEHYKLPATTKLGGVLHFLVEKPAIQLSSKDADFGLSNESKRSRLRGAASFLKKEKKWLIHIYPIDEAKAQKKLYAGSAEEAGEILQAEVGTQVKRVPQGAPNPVNYARRCREWYTGTGEYTERAAPVLSAPPVLVSETPASVLLDDSKMNSYYEQLHRLYDYATRKPEPCHFDMHKHGMENMRGLSPFAPFYVTAPRKWPDVISVEHFIQRFRDTDIDVARCPDVGVAV